MKKEQIKKFAETRQSFYIYEEEKIAEHLDALKKALPEANFLYSVKTNPHPEVVKAVLSRGLGLDAASLGEVKIGIDYGLGQDEILYSTPGKTDDDMRAAMGHAVIIVDSVGEWKRLLEIAKEENKTVRMGARINPDFTMDADKGHGGKFGIDEDQFFETLACMKGEEVLQFEGIHVHSRSQELDKDILARYYARMFDLAERVEKALGRPLRWINLGGGIGIDYGSDDKPLDLTGLGAKMNPLVEKLRASMPQVKIYIETGRFAVGKAGTYVTKVIDKKTSYGETYIILYSTLSGFIRPSLAELVTGYGGDDAHANEPLFTKKDAFAFEVLSELEGEETVNLYGNLCTGTDVVAKNITLPKMQEGDLVLMHNAGSYAAAISPMQFASLEKPEEIFIPVEQ